MKKTLSQWCIENNRNDMLEEWDYEKNCNLTPNEVAYGSDIKRYWKCTKNPEYKWIISPNTRTHYNTKCPHCTNRILIKGQNDLLTICPEIAREWDYEKNYPLTPSDFKPRSGKKVHWICSKGHKWKATIASRKTNQCPHCSKEKNTSFPEQAIYFYIKKCFNTAVNRYNHDNNELDIYIPELNLAIEYDGQRWHKDVKKDYQRNNFCEKNDITLIRIRESECPVIKMNSENVYNVKESNWKDLNKAIVYVIDYINKNYKQNFIIDVDVNRDNPLILDLIKSLDKKNSLATVNPELAKEWDYEKNGNLTPDMFLPQSMYKVWWKSYKCGHSWFASIVGRTKGNGCSVCTCRTIVAGVNDLKTTHPQLINEWDFKKNLIKPTEVSFGSNKRVWWKCKKGHSWQTFVYQRTSRKTDCPFCGRRKYLKGFNDLETLFPDIAKEWNYEKNIKVPSDYTPVSSEKVWWICPICKKEYASIIGNRTKGSICPICGVLKGRENLKLTKLKGRDLATINPQLAKEWDYKENKKSGLTPMTVCACSHKKVWWQCSKCRHKWLSTIKDRTYGTGCLKCKNKV